MNYKELLPTLKKLDGPNRIIVTGPQRAGTRFAAKTLAKDLNIPYIDELNYDIDNFGKALAMYEATQQFVMQAPALSHTLQAFPKEAIIVFMYREVTDIQASQKRIKWWSGHEKVISKKYKTVFGQTLVAFKIEPNQSQATLKYKVWEKIQKPALETAGKKHFELEYESLSSHPDYIVKDGRKNFHPSQTERKTLSIEKENYLTKNTPEDHPTKEFIAHNSKYIKGNVLDLGCNRGNVTAIMGAYANSLGGVDINPKAIEVAKKNYPQHTWNCFPMWKIRLPREAYDTLTTFHALEHIYREDLPEVVSEIAGLLKPGGYLLVSIPYKNKGFATGAHGQHVTTFDLENFTALFEVLFEKETLQIAKYKGMEVINAVYKKRRNS